MNEEQAVEQILKAFDEHDDARITRASMVEVVTKTISELAKDAYDEGLDEGFDNGLAHTEEDDEDDYFETGMDLFGRDENADETGDEG